MYEILIVDDDIALLDMVQIVLEREGYRVLRAHSPRIALDMVAETTPDLVVLDAMMPDMDGIALCRKLRGQAQTANVPILFLTGQGGTYGVVDALRSGGDDYLRKPFNPRELAARIRALIRRSVQYSDGEAAVIRIVPAQFRVFVNDREVSLTRVEFELLRYLAATPYHLHSTEELLENVWQYPNGVGDAALVRNHIHNLRRKIEADPERPVILQSRHGRGYVIKARTQVEEGFPSRVT